MGDGFAEVGVHAGGFRGSMGHDGTLPVFGFVGVGGLAHSVDDEVFVGVGDGGSA